MLKFYLNGGINTSFFVYFILAVASST